MTTSESDAAATRPRIVVLHGALGSAEAMRPVIAALGALGQVTVLEFPGHGSTPLGEGEAFGMETFAVALERAVRRVPGPAPFVFGYSMGGYAALLLASRAPELLAGVVTLGTKFEWTPEFAADEALRLDADALMEKVPRFASLLEARHEGAGGWRPLLARTAALLHDLGSAPMLTPAQLNAVSIPVCIAAGTRDDSLSAAECKRVAAAIPDAIYVALQDVPHPVERAPADMLVSIMRSLIARTEQA